jgi:hypothetical protein
MKDTRELEPGKRAINLAVAVMIMSGFDPPPADPQNPVKIIEPRLDSAKLPPLSSSFGGSNEKTSPLPDRCCEDLRR